MKNKKIIGLTAMSLVMGTTIATASADSLRERFRVPVGVSENMQAEAEALKSGNYDSWKAAVESCGNTKLLESVNESNFTKYVEAFNLRESGDMEGAKVIMDELGIEAPHWGEGGMMRGLGLLTVDREALVSAIQNADYGSWKTVMEKAESDKSGEYLTEDKFNIIVRAYKLQASGNRSGAKTLLDESNIPESMLMFGEKKMRAGRGEMKAADESKHEAIEATFKSGNFEGWKALVEERGGGKVLEIVNADNFSQFSQAKLLQEEGKMTEAKEILDELGFPFQERGSGSMKNHAFAGARK